MNFTPISRIESFKPDALNEASNSYDETQIKSYGYLYLVGENDLYMPALLKMRQEDFKKTLEWVVWVKVSFNIFYTMSQNLGKEYSSIKGIIESGVLFYDKSEGVEVLLVFDLDSKIKYPDIEILDNHSELFSDFKNGLDKEKYLTWQKRLQPLKKKKKKKKKKKNED